MTQDCFVDDWCTCFQLNWAYLDIAIGHCCIDLYEIFDQDTILLLERSFNWT